LFEDSAGSGYRPFSRTPDPRFFCQSREHAAALALIDSLNAWYRPTPIITPLLTTSRLPGLGALRLGLPDKARSKHRLLDGVNAKCYECSAAGKCTISIISDRSMSRKHRTLQRVAFALQAGRRISLMEERWPRLLRVSVKLLK
jgi:hypothetical protein